MGVWGDACLFHNLLETSLSKCCTKASCGLETHWDDRLAPRRGVWGGLGGRAWGQLGGGEMGYSRTCSLRVTAQSPAP